MPIYVINPEDILKVEFVSDAMVNATIAMAYQKHVFKGLDNESLTLVDLHFDNVSDDALKASERGETLCEFGNDDTTQVEHVKHWLAELHVRDSRLFAALHKMSFAQMQGHSRKWHAAMARRSERMRDHGIPDDPFGAPVVMTLDGELAGWKVVWLRSNEARDTEGFVMGNCVGGGHYDKLGGTAAVFSLRDLRNAPHATIYVDARDETNSYGMGRGNANLAERYVMPAERIIVLMSLRMNLSSPTEVIKDGVHTDPRGWVYHIRNELLHREDGPAKFDPEGLEEHWYRNGRLSRDNGNLPTIIYDTGHLEFWDDDGDECEPDHPVRKIENVSVTTEYYSGGKLHRDGGPARIRERGYGLRDDVEFWQHGVQVLEDGSPLPKMVSRGYYTVTKQNSEREMFEMGPLADVTVGMTAEYVDAVAFTTTQNQELPR